LALIQLSLKATILWLVILLITVYEKSTDAVDRPLNEAKVKVTAMASPSTSDNGQGQLNCKGLVAKEINYLGCVEEFLAMQL